MGYSAADIASIRPMFQDYLVCGPVNETIDFFAVNIYEWVTPLPP
jgi:1,3-beta-glucanosyltransferase GAS1